MYQRDQAKISRYARSSPEAFARVMQFVIFTARVRLANVPANMDTAERGGDDAMSVLFGWKHKAWSEAYIHRETHFTYCEDAARHTSDPYELSCVLIEYIASLTGFGPVKAGFVVQCIYPGLGGCLDMHNIKMYGLKPRAFDNYCQFKTARRRRRKIAQYVTLCGELGGPEALWDGWCHYLAQQQPALYRNADHVSAIHCEALGLD